MSKCKGKVWTLLTVSVLSAVAHLLHESRSLAWRQDVLHETPAGSNPDLHTIVDRALARSAGAREREIEGVFCRTVTQRTQTLDGDGQVIEDGAWTYAIEPFRRVPFYRLVARNGTPLGGAARDFQEVRWKEFVDEAENRRVRRSRTRTRLPWTGNGRGRQGRVCSLTATGRSALCIETLREQ